MHECCIGDGPSISSQRWLKFNDNVVEEVAMTDELLERECFGGSYLAEVPGKPLVGRLLRIKHITGFLKQGNSEFQANFQLNITLYRSAPGKGDANFQCLPSILPAGSCGCIRIRQLGTKSSILRVLYFPLRKCISQSRQPRSHRKASP